MARAPRPLGAIRGHELVAVDADGFALDPDLRPAFGLSARVTDAATRTRRGVVVGLDGWTVGRPELHCTGLWIEWADSDEWEHLTDLSGLLSREGRRALSTDWRTVIPAWDEVYRERWRTRAALLNAPAQDDGPGPVERMARREGVPFRVTSERWSPDVDAYARGEIGAGSIRCVLCGVAPCACRDCPACGGWRVAPGAECPRCGESRRDTC